MKRRFLLLTILALLMVVGVHAQDAADPQYILAFGAGFNHYAAPQSTGWLTFGVKISPSNYSLTTLDLTSQKSTIRTGFARVLLQQDGFILTALADAGVASGEGTAGGAYSGGGSLSYDISKWTKVKNTYATANIRVVKLGGSDVQPSFGFGFAKTF